MPISRHNSVGHLQTQSKTSESDARGRGERMQLITCYARLCQENPSTWLCDHCLNPMRWVNIGFLSGSPWSSSPSCSQAAVKETEGRKLSEEIIENADDATLVSCPRSSTPCLIFSGSSLRLQRQPSRMTSTRLADAPTRRWHLKMPLRRPDRGPGRGPGRRKQGEHPPSRSAMQSQNGSLHSKVADSRKSSGLPALGWCMDLSSVRAPCSSLARGELPQSADARSRTVGWARQSPARPHAAPLTYSGVG